MKAVYEPKLKIFHFWFVEFQPSFTRPSSITNNTNPTHQQMPSDVTTLHFTHTAARDRFTYLTFVLPLTLILSATLYFLPSPTLFQILHLLFAIALLQFIGCLIDAAINK